MLSPPPKIIANSAIELKPGSAKPTLLLIPAKILELCGVEALYANRLQALLMSSIALMLLLRKLSFFPCNFIY